MTVIITSLLTARTTTLLTGKVQVTPQRTLNGTQIALIAAALVSKTVEFFWEFDFSIIAFSHPISFLPLQTRSKTTRLLLQHMNLTNLLIHRPNHQQKVPLKLVSSRGLVTQHLLQLREELGLLLEEEEEEASPSPSPSPNLFHQNPSPSLSPNL